MNCVCVLSHVLLFATPWTVANQAPLSIEFSRQEHWSGLPFPTPGEWIGDGENADVGGQWAIQEFYRFTELAAVSRAKGQKRWGHKGSVDRSVVEEKERRVWDDLGQMAKGLRRAWSGALRRSIWRWKTVSSVLVVLQDSILPFPDSSCWSTFSRLSLQSPFHGVSKRQTWQDHSLCPASVVSITSTERSLSRAQPTKPWNYALLTA